MHRSFILWCLVITKKKYCLWLPVFWEKSWWRWLMRGLSVRKAVFCWWMTDRGTEHGNWLKIWTGKTVTFWDLSWAATGDIKMRFWQDFLRQPGTATLRFLWMRICRMMWMPVIRWLSVLKQAAILSMGWGRRGRPIPLSNGWLRRDFIS